MVWSSLLSATRQMTSALRNGTLKNVVQFSQTKRVLSDGIGGKESVGEILKRYSPESTAQLKEKYMRKEAAALFAVPIALYGAWRILRNESADSTARPAPDSNFVLPMPPMPTMQNVSYNNPDAKPIDGDQPCTDCADYVDISTSTKFNSDEDEILTATPCVVIHDGVDEAPDVLIPETTSNTIVAEAIPEADADATKPHETTRGKRRRRKSKAARQESEEN